MQRRFLLVQLADIGDLILTTPAIAALREAYPGAHLALLAAEHAAALLPDGLVDELITLERQQLNSSLALLRPANLRRIFGLRQGAYDSVLFFHHFTLRAGTLKFWLIARAAGAARRFGLDNGRGWFLTDRLPDPGFEGRQQARCWLDLAALAGAQGHVRPALVRMEECRAAPLRRRKKQGPRVVIHAGSGGYSPARRWSPQAFAQVADALHKEYRAQIVLVGTADDDGPTVAAAMRHRPIDLTGQTSLPQLAGLLATADLFIGADSGVLHLAAAAGAPLLAIYGPSNHAAWGPWSPQGRVALVRSGAECSPCSYVGHEIGLREGCPARTCMEMVTAGQVLRAARSLLDGQPHEELARPVRRPPTHRRVRVLGLPVDAITYAGWMELIDRWVQEGTRCHHVCTTNPEFMMIARRDVNFRNILRRADLCIPDGVGLLWAARRLGTPLPERVTGSDGVPIIAEHAARRGWKLFFLGAAPGVAAKAAEVLREQHPGLQIVGIHPGSPAPEEENDIVQMVNDSGADILLVGYGAPAQDKWIARNLPRLRPKMAMGVGGSFDFIAGVVPRAPQWMRNAGLEWLYRLYRQPWRVWRMTRLPRFVLAVLRHGAA